MQLRLPLKDHIQSKLNDYKVFDNPEPTAWSQNKYQCIADNLYSLFSGHWTAGRIAAADYKTTILNKPNQSEAELLIASYEFITQEGRPGKSLRERIGEALCNYFGIRDLETKRRSLINAFAQGLNGGAIPVHTIYMNLIIDTLRPHMQQILMQRSVNHT